MDDNFRPEVKDAIAYSKETALEHGDKHIGTEHLLKGLLRGSSKEISLILDSLNVNYTELEKKLKEKIENEFFYNKDLEANTDSKNLHLTKQAEKALKTTFLEAKLHKASAVGITHLLLCILRNENDPVTQFLIKNNINYDLVKEKYIELFEEIEKINTTKTEGEKAGVLETAPTIEVTGPKKQDSEAPVTPDAPSFGKASLPDPPTGITLAEGTFEQESSSISLYFLEDEYSPDEIAEVLSLLSDLYVEEGGEGLIIKGHDILECDSILEPVFA